MRGTWQTTSGGGGGSGGGLVLAVIAAAVLLGSGAASAIASALVIVAIIVAVAVALAVAAGIALLVYRARQDRPGQPIAARPVYQLAAEEVRPHLDASGRPAIEPPREVHLSLTVTPDQLAAIMRYHHTGDQ
jgi:hypothetical protein